MGLDIKIIKQNNNETKNNLYNPCRAWKPTPGHLVRQYNTLPLSLRIL